MPPVVDQAGQKLAEQANGVLEQALAVADFGGLGASAGNVLGGLVVGLTVWRAVMPDLDEALALVPHHTVFSPVAYVPVPFCWNLATAHFYEASLLKAALVTPGVVALTRLLERLWTTKAILLHLLFTVTFSGFAFFAAELVHVYRTHHEKDFFLPTRGCSGLLVALAVGVRHAYPLEAVPGLPRAWGVQCQHLAFGVALLVTALGFAAPGLFEDWAFAPLALFFGWLYLRYLMWFPTAQAHGDHSPDFCFAALFPRPLRPVVGCIGTVVHSVSSVVAPGFVRLRQADADAGSSIVYDPTRLGADYPMPAGIAVPDGPGSKEYNARRAKALALLDQNLGSLLTPAASGRDLELSLGSRPPALSSLSSLSEAPALRPVADEELGPASGFSEALGDKGL